MTTTRATVQQLVEALDTVSTSRHFYAHDFSSRTSRQCRRPGCLESNRALAVGRAWLAAEPEKGHIETGEFIPLHLRPELQRQVAAHPEEE